MGSDTQSCISSEHGGNMPPDDTKRSSETFFLTFFSSTITFFNGNRTCTRVAVLSMQNQRFTTILLSAALLHLTRTFQNSWHYVFCSRTQKTRRRSAFRPAISQDTGHTARLRSKSSCTSRSWSIVDSVFFVATRWLPQRQLSSSYQARFLPTSPAFSSGMILLLLEPASNNGGIIACLPLLHRNPMKELLIQLHDNEFVPNESTHRQHRRRPAPSLVDEG